jgi:hypothetical protein
MGGAGPSQAMRACGSPTAAGVPASTARSRKGEAQRSSMVNVRRAKAQGAWRERWAGRGLAGKQRWAGLERYDGPGAVRRWAEWEAA